MQVLMTIQGFLLVAFLVALLSIYSLKAFRHHKRYAFVVLAGLLLSVAVMAYGYFFPIVDLNTPTDEHGKLLIDVDRWEWYKASGLTCQTMIFVGLIGEIVELARRSAVRT
jgi:predicted membrane channel-forming protein YqfA (hemolysin III family)